MVIVQPAPTFRGEKSEKKVKPYLNLDTSTLNVEGKKKAPRRGNLATLARIEKIRPPFHGSKPDSGQSHVLTDYLFM